MNIFDELYKRYDAWYDRNRSVYLSELEALRKVLPKKGKGLEIGVGTGRFARDLGIQYGIDPSKNMVSLAKKRGVEVKVGVGERLPFDNNTFDYVAIIVTLCFVKDPLKVIQEAKRVLKQKGKIIIAVIDKESVWGRFYQKKKSIFYEHATFFSIKEIACLLNEVGFDRISYRQTLFAMPNQVEEIELSKVGYGKGGFVVIFSKK